MYRKNGWTIGKHRKDGKPGKGRRRTLAKRAAKTNRK